LLGRHIRVIGHHHEYHKILGGLWDEHLVEQYEDELFEVSQPPLLLTSCIARKSFYTGSWWFVQEYPEISQKASEERFCARSMSTFAKRISKIVTPIKSKALIKSHGQILDRIFDSHVGKTSFLGCLSYFRVNGVSPTNLDKISTAYCCWSGASCLAMNISGLIIIGSINNKLDGLFKFIHGWSVNIITDIEVQ